MLSDNAPEINNPDEILTVAEVARRLRVASSWVYSHADFLGAYRLEKYLRFSWKRVTERLERHSDGLDVGVTAQRPPEGSID
jgi:hypothetical protein